MCNQDIFLYVWDDIRKQRSVRICSVSMSSSGSVVQAIPGSDLDLGQANTSIFYHYHDMTLYCCIEICHMCCLVLVSRLHNIIFWTFWKTVLLVLIIDFPHFCADSHHYKIGTISILRHLVQNIWMFDFVTQSYYLWRDFRILRHRIFIVM